MSDFNQAAILNLPMIQDTRGNLSVVEGTREVPFEIKRVFYLYDVPGGADRAGHALKSCEQFIIAASGSFDVKVDDGTRSKKFQLSRSYYGLYLPPMCWREIDNFSSGSVCLVLASEFYDENGYYRDHDSFLTAIKEK